MTAAARKLAAAPKPRKGSSASAAAREAEAENGFVTIKQCGVTLRIPTHGKVPVAAIDAFRDGDNYEGTKQMIGLDQWKKLSDAGMTRDDLEELGTKLGEALGN